MAGYTFDTLEASKRLREAGMAEGVAEAVVAVFQHATTGLDLSHLATKTDLRADLADTKAELKADLAELRAELTETKSELKADIAELRRATMDDLAELRRATKDDLADVRGAMATKTDLERVRAEMATRADMFSLEVRMVKDVRDTVRAHTFGAVATLGVIIGIAATVMTAVLKYAP